MISVSVCRRRPSYLWIRSHRAAVVDFTLSERFQFIFIIINNSLGFVLQSPTPSHSPTELISLNCTAGQAAELPSALYVHATLSYTETCGSSLSSSTVCFCHKFCDRNIIFWLLVALMDGDTKVRLSIEYQ